MNTREFRTRYRSIEQRFQHQAHADGDVYLPNVSPKGQVDYVFIAMEPSLHSWASTNEDAREKIRKGFRNFLHSFEDFLLHHSIREYLCEDGQTYHITDVSKGAMSVDEAEQEREKRYLAWFRLLMDELELIRKPNSAVFAIGNSVESFLQQQGFTDLSATLLHYSRQAARWRKKCIENKEDEFSTFAKEVGLDDILRTASSVFVEAGIPETIRHETMGRLKRAKLTRSRKMLLFCYKSTFAEWRK